jgi:hypothetical protein
MVSQKKICFSQRALAIPFALLVGCAGSSLRPVETTYELPPDLPSEIKKKFEIRDSSFLGDSATRLPTGLTEEDDRSVKKHKKKHGHQKKGLNDSPLVYPNRRPDKDPIWVGEKLSYSITYLGLLAADLDVEVKPFKLLNDRKVYHIHAVATTSPVFGLFYRVNDSIETFIDYEGIF